MQGLYKFEIRFADSGFSQKFQNLTSIEALQHEIQNKFKIEIPNQKIISKKGTIIAANSKFDAELMKKTFSADPKNPQEMAQYMGMYLYSHKELMRVSSAGDRAQRWEESSRRILNEKHSHYEHLKSEVYQFLEPLDQRFSQLQIAEILAFNPILVGMVKDWQQKTSQLIKNSETYKEDYECLEEHIQKWEYQRKALMVLTRNLEILSRQKTIAVQNIAKNLADSKAAFQKLSKPSLSSSESIKQKEKEVVQLIETLSNKLKTVSSKQDLIKKRVDIYRRNLKEIHSELQKPVKKLDEDNHKKLRSLTSYAKEMKQTYSRLIDALKEKLEGREDKIVRMLAERDITEKKFKVYYEEGIEDINMIEKNFEELYRMYVEHEALVKSEYRTYHDIFTEFEGTRKSCFDFLHQLHSLNKSIQILAQVCPASEQALAEPPKPAQATNPIAQSEQSQYKRRILFNIKLQCLQQQAKQILAEEENTRRKFRSEMIEIDDRYDNQILGNVGVPCLLVNYDQSSDRELMAKMRTGSRVGVREMREGFGEIDVEMYRENLGLDRILKELDIVKNCQVSLKSQNTSTESKVKNMQLLLQKSSDIFHRIYTHKLSHLTKQHTISQQAHQTRITALQTQNKQLHNRIYTYTQSISLDIQAKNQLEMEIERLRAEVEDGERKFAEAERKLGESENNVRRYEGLLEKERRELERERREKKHLEDKLEREVGNTMETLYCELEKTLNTVKELEEMNHEYKVVMGDQAIKIATLETQLLVLKQDQPEGMNGDGQQNQMKQLKDSFYGIAPLIITQHNSEQPQPDNEPQSQPLQSEPNPPTQVPLLKKNSKSITTEQLKQIQREITKLEKKIQELNEQNQQLRTENIGLNDQIMKIAMKDMEDVEVQTQGEGAREEREIVMETNVIGHLHLTGTKQEIIRIDGSPQPGQLRIFLPHSPGLYIAIKTHPQPHTHTHLSYPQIPPNLPSQTRNYLTLHQTELLTEQQSNLPYILDMNCLYNKARELLTECTLVVVVRVTKILPAFEKFYVQGEIVSAVGFQDQEMGVKDYGPLLR